MASDLPAPVGALQYGTLRVCTRRQRSRRLALWRLLLASATGVLGPVLWANPAGAQIRFQWPAAALDVGRYTTVEECLAATARVRDSTRNRYDAWRDTMPLSPEEARTPAPAPVVVVAQRCGTRFFADTTRLNDFAPLLQLYLEAGRDAEAEALVRRRLAAITPKADSERAAVLDTVAARYLDVQPRRLALAEPIIEQLARSKAIALYARVERLVTLEESAEQAGDTARMHRAARAILTALETASDAEKRATEFQAVQYRAFFALERLDHAALMDSLRRSTAGYVAVQRAAWAKVTGQSPEALAIIMPIGERAKPLEGKFWFVDGAPSAATAAKPPARPTPGRVSLVVFSLDTDKGEMCLKRAFDASCWEQAAVLRRLARRFPELEITIVSKTQGFVGRLEPPTPAEEAELYRKVWAEYYHLPGMFLVKETAFWRLPGLDRRRINRDDPDWTYYEFGKTWNMGGGSVFLVDPDGIVVYMDGTLTREREADFAERIDVLLHRNAKGA